MEQGNRKFGFFIVILNFFVDKKWFIFVINMGFFAQYYKKVALKCSFNVKMLKTKFLNNW